MNADDISKMIDAISQYSEMLGGLRKQIMNQGFSEDIADQLVLEILKKTGS